MMFRYRGVSRLQIFNDGKSHSKESDFSEFEVPRSNCNRGLQV